MCGETGPHAIPVNIHILLVKKKKKNKPPLISHFEPFRPACFLVYDHFDKHFRKYGGKPKVKSPEDCQGHCEIL